MILWSYHPSTLNLDDPMLKIDPTKGTFWKQTDPGFRYQEVLPKLHELVGIDQLLWCCTKKGGLIRQTENDDLVEWKLEIPFCDVDSFFRVQVWEDIVRSRSDDWENLIITELNEDDALDKNIDALLRVPLINTVRITCQGPPPPRYPRKN